ncbi:DUF262 domain-containing HNH endonuclease family protein [Dietzia maris]|uniref:DUF262 domain-containing protein n=1 Tax=Dietzia maris TaxID=37915 RepID=UPI0022B41DAF|nr:DUF262 domain-containing HNH endonuclease family protein [Dietzia maris]MCZ4541368.1 DUF262 domain-containing HNH endonuclease family protein [Dietzia maris]
MAIANTVTLTDLFDGRVFRVPEYQRPFAWERQQLLDLWNDLDLLGPDSADGHFAGTIILRENAADGSSTALPTVDIVDGQQRLTACLILLSAIRRACLTLRQNPQARVLADHIYSSFLRTGPETWRPVRLTLARGADTYWKEAVVEDSGLPHTQQSGAEQRIDSAMQYFAGNIERLLDSVGKERGFAVLDDLYKRVTTGLRFIHFEVSTSSDVGVIFETVNDRGLALTELEKVKNYLMFLNQKLDAEPAHDLTELIEKCWSDIHRNVGAERRAGDNLLRAYWLATRGSARSAPTGAQAVKEEFDRARYLPDSYRLGAPPDGQATKRQDPLYTEIKELVTGLRDCSVYLHEFNSGDAEYTAFGDSVRDDANRLSILLRRASGTARFLPLIFVQRMRAKTAGEAYCELLAACLTHRVRVSVLCGYRSGTGAYGLASSAKTAWDLGSGFDLSRDVLANCAYYASDDQVWDRATNPSNWYSRQSLKFFLYEYEKHLTGGEGSLAPFEEFVAKDSIEHIAPQKLGYGWKTTFGDDRDLRYRHTLGNLVLTYDNSAYSNKPFRRKQFDKPGYKDSRLFQEKELASSYREWTPTTVMHRQTTIVEWALRRWPLTVSSGGDSGESAMSDAELELLGGDPDD